MKKHFKQFTPEEKAFLEEVRKDIKLKGFTLHAIERQKQKNIRKYFKKADYKEAIENGRIIEVSKNHKGVKMVFRSAYDIEEQELVFSLAIKNGMVVTNWMNDIYNQHDNVYLGAYDEDMDIIEVIKEELK